MSRSFYQHKAWLVDLDGTLYRAPAVRLAMAAELALGNWRYVQVLKVFRREQERLRQEAHEPVASVYQLQMERAAQQTKRRVSEVEAIVQEWMVRRPGKWLSLFRRKALLQEIHDYRKQGGRTALVSDYPARDKLQALGASNLFDVVIANGEIDAPPRLKPWPDGYNLAAQKLAILPADCLVVGDREDADGEAARRAGMSFRRI